MIDVPESPKVDLVVSGDGSHTLKLRGSDEHYHSTHGAFEEAQHVYINNGLELFADMKVVGILEVGFGTGANALLSEYWGNENKISIEYTGLELFPLAAEVLRELNYSELLDGKDRGIFDAITSAFWEEAVFISSELNLKKIKMDVQDLHTVNAFDLIYFDAFGPETQPELWTKEVFQKLYNACKKGAVLVTYCAKGQVRRDLQSVGFLMERLPGPPAKRHMLRATKP